MRLLILVVGVLLGAALVAHLAVSKPGYLLFSYGQTSIEMPLVDFLVLMLVLLGLLYLLIRAVLFVWHSPRDLRKLGRRFQGTRARKAFLRGLIDMAEGRWAKAEKRLVKSARYADAPVLNYLAAAQVAQRQHAIERRDTYLRHASQADPKAEVAVGLAQADLQMRQGQYEEALATLRRLSDIDAKHPQVLKLLVKAFYQLKDWEHLKELLPALHGGEAVSSTEVERIRLELLRAEISKLTKQGDLKELHRLWKSLGKNDRSNPSLLRPYALALNRLGESAEAEALLNSALAHQWEEGLALAYGEIDFRNPHEALKQVDTWLREKGRSAELLCSAGRINAQAALWGKARSLLRESLKAKPLVETYEALGQLHERLQEIEDAEKIYKEGFRYLAKEQAAH